MAMLQTGLSCRVWFPDAVMEAGDKLREALEGRNAANIDHLRRTHPAAKFTVKGQPSTALSPWRRLHVVITCPEPKILAKAEADVLDLCETACDVAADFLGLSDDQVQDVFEGIRVERQEVPLRTEDLPAEVPQDLNFLWQTGLDSQAPPGPAWPTEPKSSSSSSSPGMPEVLRGTTPKSSMPKSPFIRDPNAPPPGSASTGTPSAPSGPSGQSGPSTARKAGVPAAFAGRSVPTAVPMTLNSRQKIPMGSAMGSQMIPPLPSMMSMMPPPPMVPMTGTPMTPGMQMPPMPPFPMPAASQPAVTPPGLLPLLSSPAPTTPAATPATPATPAAASAPVRSSKRPHTIDQHLEVARLAQAWLNQGAKQPEKAEKKKKRKVEVDPYLPPKAEDNPYLVMLAEAEAEDAAERVQPIREAMPPPSSTVAHKRKADPSDLSGQPSKASPADAQEKAQPVRSDSETSSESEGEESEDGEDDEIEEVPTEGEADGGARKLELFKLGAKCCSVLAQFVGGRKALLRPRLDIDQRVRLEHCRKHLQWAGDLTTIWHFALSDLSEEVAWTTLCTYFVSRQRVGLAELKGGVVYIVPPDDSFISELGLPASVKSLKGSLLGLQVPIYEQEGEQGEQGDLAEQPETQRQAVAEAAPAAEAALSEAEGKQQGTSEAPEDAVKENKDDAERAEKKDGAEEKEEDENKEMKEVENTREEKAAREEIEKEKPETEEDKTGKEVQGETNEKDEQSQQPGKDKAEEEGTDEPRHSE